MNYTRIHGRYTAKMPWGEEVTADAYDTLIHNIGIAHRREVQRRELAEQQARQERENQWRLAR